MARISIEVPDDQLFALLESSRGLERGQSVNRPELSIDSIPPASNNAYSHLVTVKLTYAFKPGEIDTLIRP